MSANVGDTTGLTCPVIMNPIYKICSTFSPCWLIVTQMLEAPLLRIRGKYFYVQTF